MTNANLSEQVLIALRQIIRAVDIHSRKLVQQHGLTGPQLVVLRALARLAETPVGKLAEEVSLSHATVTGVVDRLEKQGLVQRARSDEDRRRVLVTITQAGQETLKAAPPLLQEEFVTEFLKLRDWEQSLILSSLQRVADMMQAKGLEAESVLEYEPLPVAAKETVDIMAKTITASGRRNQQAD
jgi:DNA-binding MarR family transcriptional regulator